jgi:hypothetical protein
MLSEKLKQAIKLIKSGEKQKGGQLLAEVLKADPGNEMAWLWMSLTVTTRKQRRDCLEKVLIINPHNEQAQQALAELERRDNNQFKDQSQVSPKAVTRSHKHQPTSSARVGKPLSKEAVAGVSSDLGTPIGEWKGKSGRYIWGVLGVILGIIMIGVCPNTPTNQGAIGIFLYFVGSSILGLSLFVGVKVFLERDLRVRAYSDGLVQTKRGTNTVIRWHNIVAVWQNVTDYTYYRMFTYDTTHCYTIQLNNNRKLQFDDSIKNVAELGNVIQQQVTKRQLPDALKALEQGGTIPFGKLSVSAQGLSNGKETIPWWQVESVRLDRGIITVKKEGKWLNWSSIRVAETPNILVFLTLVDTIVGVK